MVAAEGTFDIRQKSGEIRVNGSSFGDHLNWIGGVFVMNSDDFVGGYINYLKLSETVTDSATARDRSGFLHAEWKFNSKFSISGGARYSYVKKTYTFNRPELLVLPAKEAKENHVDWLVSANYQFTDDFMAYASVSTGSRPPGLNVHPATQNQVTPFPGERLTAYEVGIKSEWLDHKLRVNLTGFYSDYKVRNTSDPGFECLAGPYAGANPQWQPVVANCGNNPFVYWNISIGAPASITGFEWETILEPVKGLLFNVAGGYNHFKSGVTTAGQPGYIFPGNFPQPEWNASAGAQVPDQDPGRHDYAAPRCELHVCDDVWSFDHDDGSDVARSGSYDPQWTGVLLAERQQVDGGRRGHQHLQQVLLQRRVRRLGLRAELQRGAAA